MSANDRLFNIETLENWAECSPNMEIRNLAKQLAGTMRELKAAKDDIAILIPSRDDYMREVELLRKCAKELVTACYVTGHFPALGALNNMVKTLSNKDSANGRLPERI